MPTANDRASARTRWIALLVVCTGQLMMVLDATIVNVALPFMQRDLHFAQADLAWVIDAYMIAFGSFLLLAGRLGDLIGRKRVFLAGIVLFTVASIACGLADTRLLLIGARFVQGLGGALASAVVLAILVTEFPRADERAKAMSVYTFTVSAGGSIGLLAGGILTQVLDWHWIFFINVPIGLVTFLLGRVLIKESEALGLTRDVDVLGSVQMTVAMMIGVYAIVKVTDYGWLSGHTLGFGAVSIALLAVFARRELRHANPIFPPRVLRIRGLIATSIVRAFLITGMFSTFLLGVLYLQHVGHFGAFKTGLAFLPMTLIMGTLSAGLSARIMRRMGSLPMLTTGLGMIVVALLLLAGAPDRVDYFPSVAVPFALLGLGAGLAFLPLMTIAMANVPSADAGLASGVVNASLQIAGAVGVAVLGTISANRSNALVHAGDSVSTALTGGYHLAWVIGAASVAVGAVIALALLRTPPARPQELSLRPGNVEFEAEAA